MFNVYLGDRLLTTCLPTQEKVLQDFCSLNNITFVCNENRDYYLFPPLHGLTFALLSREERDEESDAFIKQLAEKLTDNGALVVNVTLDKSFRKLMKVMDVKAIIGYMVKNNQDGNTVRFFYSLRKKEESLRIISAIGKELLKKEYPIKFLIPGAWSILLKSSYSLVSLLTLPAVMIEIDKDAPNVNMNLAVISTLINLYGRKNMVEHLKLGQELVEILKSKTNIEEEEKIESLHNLKEQTEEIEKDLPSGTKTGEEEGISVNEVVDLEMIGNAKVKTKTDLPYSVNDTRKKSRKVKEKKKKSYKINTFNPPGDAPVFKFIAEGQRNDYIDMQQYFSMKHDRIPIASNKILSWEELCKAADIVKNQYKSSGL